MIEEILIGVTRGITEWLPVSSEGAILLLKSNIFGGAGNLNIFLGQLYFSEIGVFLATLIFFRHDITELLFSLIAIRRDRYQEGIEEQIENKKKILIFLSITTVFSALVAFAILFYINKYVGAFPIIAPSINLFIFVIFVFLFFYEIFSLSRFGQKNDLRDREYQDLKIFDAFVLGLIQGFSVIPGFSRSGLTIAAMLLQRFSPIVSFRLSMLMSLPFSLSLGLMFGHNDYHFGVAQFIVLAVSFGIGYLMLTLITRFAKKIKISYFILAFGLLSLLAYIFFAK